MFYLITMNSKDKLLNLYDILPFEKHPLWKAVLSKELSYKQVIEAETQHYLRTKAGQKLRRSALELAQEVSPNIFECLLQTYLEECTHDASGPSHLDLITRLVVTGGKSETDLLKTINTPGNAAAISLYADISKRGAGCHMLGAGVVEYYYSKLSPKIYEAYHEKYGMTADQAETYLIHGPMDEEHADRAFSVLDDAVNLHGWDEIETSVRDAFVATSLHYDGMLQAAIGELRYWDGK